MVRRKETWMLAAACLCAAVVLAEVKQRPAPVEGTDPQPTAADTNRFMSSRPSGSMTPEGAPLAGSEAETLLLGQSETSKETILSNMGGVGPAVYTGHVLSHSHARGGAILFAPTEADDAGFRADLADLTGDVVDYYDARTGTPDLELLLTYDCVFTWVNYAYSDPVAMGDNLADYADAGGKVILGQWTLHTNQVNWLQGRIVDPGEPYLPISASTYSSGTYAEDGTGCYTADVGSFSSNYRDDASLISGAMTDGTFTDGVPFIANNPGITVAYIPGALTLAGQYTGDLPEMIFGTCNCLGYVEVYGACCDDANGTCADGVEQLDCLGQGGRFAADTACADLDPPCGDLLGACCGGEASGWACLGDWTLGECLAHPDEDVTWHAGESCDDPTFWCPQLTTGACCDDSTGECVDGVPPGDCQPPWIFTPGVLCADLPPPCGPGGYPCGDPAAGDCCVPNGTPACDDAVCCESVCSYDPYCCDTMWDTACADEAATDPACDCGPCRDTFCGWSVEGVPFCAEMESCLTVEPCSSSTECPAGELCLMDDCCEPPNNCAVVCDTCFNPGYCGTYEDCVNPCGDPTAGDCCTSNGTPGCEDAACCESVCSYDSYCCEAVWDQICADEAATDPNCDCKCAPPGPDCWTTLCDGGTSFNFNDDPIPAGFFYPGSPPFDGVVRLGDPTGSVGTQVQRLDPMCFPDPLPSTASTSVEIVELSLVSCEPIDVGGNPYDVYVQLAGPQQQGILTATKTHPIGGTYTASVPVEAEFMFAPAGGPPEIGPLPAPPVVLDTIAPTQWLQEGGWSQCGGTGFFPGFGIDPGTGEICCQPTCHDAGAGYAPGHKHCTTPPDCPPCPSGACCDHDGTCLGNMTEEKCDGLQGNWDEAGDCYDPNYFCPVDCNWHNGPPLDDWGQPSSQYDWDWPFSSEAADDFVLKDAGENWCLIYNVTTWVMHMPGSGSDGREGAAPVSAAAAADSQMADPGAERPVVFGGLTAAEARELAASASVEVPAGLQMTNMGEERPVIFEGHVLTTGERVVGGTLYAPTEPDNPAFRAALEAIKGGPVDYFDARVATPSLGLLCDYECVLTWVDFAYFDSVAMGNVLADYVDQCGGTVILGQWCLQSDQSFWLDGAIMTPAYSPVSAISTSYNSGAYAGDGTDCVHTSGPVVAYDTQFLDTVTALSPGALSDGTFASTGSVSVAWRPGRAVYYSAGHTGGALTISGLLDDWPRLTANMCWCEPGPTPKRWKGVTVTVYADMGDPKGPAGHREDDGTFTEYVPGGLVATHFVPAGGFEWARMPLGMFPCSGDPDGDGTSSIFRLDIPVGIKLEKNVKYWLVIQPELSEYTVNGQTFIMYSRVNHDHPAQQIFQKVGLPWTEVPGNSDACPPDTPPAGTKKDLAFILWGTKIAEPAGACCYLDFAGRPTCVEETQAVCEAPGPPPGGYDGDWQGPWTECPTEGVSTQTHNGVVVVHVTDPSALCGSGPGRDTCIEPEEGELPVDAWRTALDADICHQFGVAESPAIPPDFFGPGSDPFVGQACLEGEPIGDITIPGVGDVFFEYADTLVQRAADPFDRCEVGSFPLGPVSVEAELIALSLVSIDPITVTYNGGMDPEEWDVKVDLSVAPQWTDPGHVTAYKTHCNGGTYNSVLRVQPRFTFTRVGDGAVEVLDTGLEGIDPVTLIQDDNPSWTSDLSETLGLEEVVCTDFHPGIEDSVPTTDCDCNANSIRDVCETCGDNDGDGDADLDDLATFAGCMTGPDGSASAACRCMLDANEDGDLDLEDFAVWQVECFTGP